MEKLWKGLAILGIWIGVGLVAVGMGIAGIAVINVGAYSFVMVATIVFATIGTAAVITERSLLEAVIGAWD